jgi:phenylacetate-CoA ligase
MAQRLIELAPSEIGASVASIGVQALLLAGEPGGGVKEVRDLLTSEFGISAIFDGMLGAWGVSKISCNGEGHWGLHHLTEDYFLHEIYETDGNRAIPLVDGAVGRVVYTSLLHEARPCIKHATGDIVRVESSACPGCGRKLNRFTILGRADDMVIIRGVNVYPGALREMVQKFFPTMNGEMRFVVPSNSESVHDSPTLKVEVRSSVESDETMAVCRALEERVQDVLRIRVVVQPVALGSLSTSGRKSQLIERSSNSRGLNEGDRT